jgi:hypothetical protein
MKDGTPVRINADGKLVACSEPETTGTVLFRAPVTIVADDVITVAFPPSIGKSSFNPFQNAVVLKISRNDEVIWSRDE